MPPYEVFSLKPQPKAELMALLNAKYIFSPYPLEDKGFVLKEKIEEIFVYENSLAIGQAFLETEEGKMPLKINYYSPNKIAVGLEPGLEGKLILSEVFYPGWQAKIDHQKVEIKIAYDILRSVEIPRGSREVVFIYQPKSFKIGLVITFLTLLGMGSYLVIHAKDKN